MSDDIILVNKSWWNNGKLRGYPTNVMLSTLNIDHCKLKRLKHFNIDLYGMKKLRKGIFKVQ